VDETECVVIVEGQWSTPEQAALAHNFLYSGDRRYIEQPLKRTPPPIILKRNSVTSTKSVINQKNTNKQINENSEKTSSDRKVNGIQCSTSGENLNILESTRSRSAIKDSIATNDPAMCKPEFVKSLQDLSVVDGDHLVLECFIKGVPEPQVTWKKNKLPITSSDIINLKYRNGKAMLIINEVFPEDEGIYSCVAQNSVGVTETHCKLSVTIVKEKPAQEGKCLDTPPKILNHLESRVVKDGDSVTLTCRIGEAKHFDVVWLHNNKEIKSSKDFEYCSEANIYKLKIAEIYPEDSGIYTCEAFNNYGESFSTCTIDVVRSSEIENHIFLKFPMALTVIEDETATFECETKADISKVVWLKDGIPVNENNGRYSFTKDGNKYSFFIKNSKAEDIGQYQTKAFYGNDEKLCAFSLNVIGSDQA